MAYRIFRYLLAAPFVFAGFYHLLTIIFPNSGEPAPLERHLLFIGINFAMTFFHFWRPKVFFTAASILIIQQLYSHGTYGLEVYDSEARIDWYSALVVFGFPLYLLLYYKLIIQQQRD